MKIDFKHKRLVSLIITVLVIAVLYSLSCLAVNYLVIGLSVLVQYVLSFQEAPLGAFSFQFKYLYTVIELVHPLMPVLMMMIFYLLSGRRLTTSLVIKLVDQGDIYGTSRWLSRREIKKTLHAIDLQEPSTAEKSGMILASDIKKAKYRRISGEQRMIETDIKHYYVDPATVNLLCIGTTRSGKDQLVINPSIRMIAQSQDKHSFIVNDPKGETAETTYQVLHENGYDVYVLNLRDPAMGSCWNPLQVIQASYIKEKDSKDFSKTMELAGDLAQVITNNPKSDPVWPESAKSLLIALIMFLVERTTTENQMEKFNMYSLYNFFLETGSKEIRKGYSVENELDKLMSELPSGHPAKLAYATSKFAQGEMRSSIFSTLAGNLQIFADSGIAAMTAQSEINVSKIADKPTAIFMIIPDDRVNRYPLASLFINQAYSELVSEAMTYDNQTLPRRVQFVLNEFGNMVSIPAMATKMTVSLGRNILFNIFVQSIAQIEDKYDATSAKTIIGNCGNQVYINSMDQDTNELYSKMLSNETIEYIEMNLDTSKLIEEHGNQRQTGKALMTADELSRMDYGSAVVLRQRSHPIKTTLVPYVLQFPQTKTRINEIARYVSERKPLDQLMYLPKFKAQNNQEQTGRSQQQEKSQRQLKEIGIKRTADPTNQEIKQVIKQLDEATAGKFVAAIKHDDETQAKHLITQYRHKVGMTHELYVATQKIVSSKMKDNKRRVEDI